MGRNIYKIKHHMGNIKHHMGNKNSVHPIKSGQIAPVILKVFRL